MNNPVWNHLKKALFKSHIFLLLFITSAVVGFEYHRSFIANPTIKEWQTEKFQKTFLEKEKNTRIVLKKLGQFVEQANTPELIKDFLLQVNKDMAAEDLMVYVYKNDSIFFWSSNKSPIPQHYSTRFKHDQKPIDLGNAIYYALTEPAGPYLLVALFRVKNDYSIQNRFLDNSFHEDFNIGQGTNVSIDHCLNCKGIYNQNGNRVFSLEMSPLTHNDISNYLSFFLYLVFLAIILLMLFSIVFTRSIRDLELKNSVTLVWIFLFILVRAWVQVKLKPLFETNSLFDPSLFASSDFLASLGDLLLHALFFFVITILIYENFNISFSVKKPAFLTFRFYTYSLVVFILAVWFVHLFASLIQNSNISFEIYKVLNINVYTLFSLLALTLIIVSICLLFDKILLVFKKYQKGFKMRKHIFVLFGLFVALLAFFAIEMIAATLLALLFVGMYFYRVEKAKTYTFLRFIVLILFFTVFAVYFIIEKTSAKQAENKKVLAVNLATEHDYIAEILLENVQKKIQKDERLSTALFSGDPAGFAPTSYIKSKYFGGYLDKYETDIHICSPLDTLGIDGKIMHCYPYFYGLIARSGINIPNSDFYFLDNLNSRIGYLGQIILLDEPTGKEISLFIRLQSKLVDTELGYPELLIRSTQSKNIALNEYSYAKYHMGELIAKSGEYPYPLIQDRSQTNEFETEVANGFSHLYYKPDGENLIVITHSRLKTSHILYTFSYLFSFYLLVMGLLYITNRIQSFKDLYAPTFRNKIQFSMLLVLIISLLLIGSFTIYLNVQQYKNKHFEFISEKLQSVQIELVHKLAGENELTKSWNTKGYDNLEELLRKFSNVFFSDINLYTLDGNLLASSRPEIFTLHLQSPNMNPRAFHELNINKKAEFIHSEQIGKMDYLSGYVPFFNENGQKLAYLNLPYFTRQQLLTREISNLVVTMLNIYVLLFLLTTALAFVMSEQITRPLKMIQDSFKKVKLGLQNKTIEYDRADEIAGMIKEYNRMVIELSENAAKLAKSEREMAWREMARQIAHEIKNPLTPIKLNIQQLQRVWKDRSPQREEMLDKVTSTIIEQINTLSNIATEFSNFAKMPQPKNEVVNIISKIKNTVKLFEQTENVKFETRFHGHDEINIYADKEQVMRILNNLVKNAIQSIPEDRDGTISIETKTTGNKVQVLICDNGRGIPEEIHSKLFQPNFTTKSSGMGLGLSIVKKIVDTSNGSISFQSELDKGTCFTLEWEVFK
jgi:two-component system, NtrC family, nitrogen regulation sensor histidine kinase NtrY